MEALVSLVRGAGVDGMASYELGDSNHDPLQALVFVRLGDPSPVLVGRPALLSVADGHARTLVRRESLTDLLPRDADHSGE